MTVNMYNTLSAIRQQQQQQQQQIQSIVHRRHFIKRHYSQICNYCMTNNNNNNTIVIGIGRSFHTKIFLQNEKQLSQQRHILKKYFIRTTAPTEIRCFSISANNDDNITTNNDDTNIIGYGRIWKASSISFERSTTAAITSTASTLSSSSDNDWLKHVTMETNNEKPQYWTNRIIDSSKYDDRKMTIHNNNSNSNSNSNNESVESDVLVSNNDKDEDSINFDDDDDNDDDNSDSYTDTNVNIKQSTPLASNTTKINHRESDFVLFPSISRTTTTGSNDDDTTTTMSSNSENTIPISSSSAQENTDKKKNEATSTNTNNTNIETIIQKIIDSQRGEMRQCGLGVLHVDPVIDIQLLTDNYTVKAVAAALRDREDALQQAAVLSTDPTNNIVELQKFLEIFHPKFVLERRKQTKHIPTGSTGSKISTNSSSSGSNNTTTGTNSNNMNTNPITSLQYVESRNVIRKSLMRMPRTVSTAHSKRAGVCIALCTVRTTSTDNNSNDSANGSIGNNNNSSILVPSILLERRALHMRNFPGEVCLPGGMVCDIQDQTIVSTSIREMKEEIYGLDINTNDTTTNNNNENDNTNNTNTNTNNSNIEVLGVLRLNWGEVQYLTGVAVTPVVCYLGELPNTLYPNPHEVSEIFTIPLIDLLNQHYWIHRPGLAPIFIGGPYAIWGLTGYILERLAKDILRPLSL